MKKITLLAIVAGSLSLASCKKDRTCTCTSSVVSKTSTQPGYTYTPGPSSTTTTKYTKIKKNNVLANTCVVSETTDEDPYNYGGTTYVTTTVTKNDCKLK